MTSTAAFMRKMNQGESIDPEAFLKTQKEKPGVMSPPAQPVKASPGSPAKTETAKKVTSSSVGGKKVETVTVQKALRVLPPPVKAGDSDEVRDIKKKIQDTENEVQEMLRKLSVLNERMARVILILEPELMETITSIATPQES
eukprot:CAMPEP_0182441538 /NCGR_PEP_ID=MMETSP1172-20130603/518_1 /TAXON_ID=708627 /ORGANISM="Timspurckia oligopyrenoides, Strain CCMP3278" /LENGTH=142 /DNA_ID=CAMNT_0024635887 /DNA_START=42 /DNA_END=470 /DNA_ORIENTATION=+